MSIKDRSILFLEAGKKNTFYQYGQKCLPNGIINEGQIVDRETLILLLEEIVSDNKLKGKTISYCIPDSVVIVRKISIPEEILDDEITGYLYMQLGETIHLPFDDPILEAVPINNTQENREAILIASKESVLNEFTSVFKEVQLKPVVADLSLLSIYRTYFHADLANPEDHLLLVQIGLDYMLLSVFYQHKPVFVRHYPFDFSEEEVKVVKSRIGFEYYTWTGSKDSLLGKSRDITSEIERFLSYFRFNFSNEKEAITKIVVTGDHPCTSTFAHELSLAVEVEIQSLIDPLFQTKKGVNIPAIFTECIGLALK
jgi:type IV pilus assembly protein PilM